MSFPSRCVRWLLDFELFAICVLRKMLGTKPQIEATSPRAFMDALKFGEDRARRIVERIARRRVNVKYRTAHFCGRSFRNENTCWCWFLFGVYRSS